MANYKVGAGYSSDMSVFDFSALFEGTQVVATKKMYSLESAEGKINVHGEDFKYATDGLPKGGVVEGYIQYNAAGEQAISFGGYGLSVKAFAKAASTVSTNDDFNLLAQILFGNDNIIGAELSDTLGGFAGKDKLYGGGSGDVLIGGSGADKYVYLSTDDSTLLSIDTIVGFAKGDKIALSAIADYEFIGQSNAFTGGGAEVAFAFIDGHTFVLADTDGDMNTDLAIMIEGEYALTARDFIL